jgi:hypothetical protein
MTENIDDLTPSADESETVVTRPERDPKTGRFLQGTTGLPGEPRTQVPFAGPWKNERGQFELGHTGIGGRPKGSRPKLSAMFWNDLYVVWQAKGMSVLERLADDDPAAFAKIAAMLVIKDENAGADNAARDAAIEAYIEERRQKALKMIAKMDEAD